MLESEFLFIHFVCCPSSVYAIAFSVFSNFFSSSFQITIEAMKSDIDEVALQGIEFWSNVCDEEMDLAIEASEVCVADLLHSQLFESFSFIKFPPLVFPRLLSSNGRPQSRDAHRSTPVNSMLKGLCSTWSPS